MHRPDSENPPDVPLAEQDLDIGTDASTRQEATNAIKAVKNNKTQWQDALPAELCKVSPKLAADILFPRL